MLEELRAGSVIALDVQLALDAEIVLGIVQRRGRLISCGNIWPGSRSRSRRLTGPPAEQAGRCTRVETTAPQTSCRHLGCGQGLSPSNSFAVTSREVGLDRIKRCELQCGAVRRWHQQGTGLANESFTIRVSSFSLS